METDDVTPRDYEGEFFLAPMFFFTSTLVGTEISQKFASNKCAHETP